MVNSSQKIEFPIGSSFDLLLSIHFLNVLGLMALLFEATPIPFFYQGLIDHKISQCWKNTSEFIQFGVMRKILFRRKPFAFLLV
jgi:hypothetical protein